MPFVVYIFMICWLASSSSSWWSDHWENHWGLNAHCDGRPSWSYGYIHREKTFLLFKIFAMTSSRECSFFCVATLCKCVEQKKYIYSNQLFIHLRKSQWHFPRIYLRRLSVIANYSQRVWAKRTSLCSASESETLVSKRVVVVTQCRRSSYVTGNVQESRTLSLDMMSRPNFSLVFFCAHISKCASLLRYSKMFNGELFFLLINW